MEKKKVSQKLRIYLGIVLLAGLMLTGAFFWYVSDYYPAEEEALEVLEKGDGIFVQDNLTILSAPDATDTAIVFYPGAKVEAKPTCRCLTRSGKRE